MRARLASIALVAAAGALVASGVSAASVSSHPLGAHQSIGAPNDGRLVGAKKWTDTKFAKRMHEKPKETAWAMPGMIALLQRAAKKVAQHHPRSVLWVGDLSAKNGGPLAGHHSHQNGRDADVGFYAMDERRNRQLVIERFFPFDGAGKSGEVPSAEFDDRRNWAFVQALLEDERAKVRTVFVASWLKSRLLKHASEVHVPSGILEHAMVTLMQPANAEPHHDHFHVRISCVPSQKSICHDDSIERPHSANALDVEGPGADVPGE